MVPPDAVAGWDERHTAEAYACFTHLFPMYTNTSRDLVERAELRGSRLVVDLCGGTGVTAGAALAVLPSRARVISLDASAAMQEVGRRSLHDTRLSWVTARAEDVARHVGEGADAVVCNSAIWKTDTMATFTAVRSVLRPGGRFVFNIGGGFAGVTHPDEEAARTGPSLSALIQDVAVRDYGYVPPRKTRARPKLPLEVVRAQLRAAGFRVLEAGVVAHHGTMAEKRAWLSIPIFAQPEGDLTYEQRMEILRKAYALVAPGQVTVTSWLVVVAQAAG
ncbi:class I SAM-dependent methyltransferase [Nocardiopsis changdeensis]|uniref:class I SAM-dependent methyltransferase n=1 Tax=Nocardiopsis TaxID=2013 RepID=UPI002108190C|nr:MULTISPECIES: class I SAM-dependent methyltransferase [Nocardiopsis]